MSSFPNSLYVLKCGIVLLDLTTGKLGASSLSGTTRILSPARFKSRPFARALTTRKHCLKGQSAATIKVEAEIGANNRLESPVRTRRRFDSASIHNSRCRVNGQPLDESKKAGTPHVLDPLAQAKEMKVSTH